MLKIYDSKLGYNVATDTYVDLLEAGIIDPTKVTRCALQNAGSVAGMLLTTECLIVDTPAFKPEGLTPLNPMSMM